MIVSPPFYVCLLEAGYVTGQILYVDGGNTEAQLVRL